MVRLIGWVCLLAFVAVSGHAVWGEHPGDTAVFSEIPWYGWILLTVGFVMSFLRIRITGRPKRMIRP